MPARVLICRYVDCRQETRIDAGAMPDTCPHCARPALWLALDRDDPEDRTRLTKADRRFLYGLRIAPPE